MTGRRWVGVVSRRGLGWTAILGTALPTLAAVSASAQLGVADLFGDNLDSATPALFAGFHDERFAPNTNPAASDLLQTLGFDYGPLTGSAAPGSTNTLGILASVNRVDNLPGDGPERVAVNYLPNLTLNSATQNWVATVNAFAYNTGGSSDTTLAFLAGMHTDTSRVNWQGATNTTGLFWSLTTDGKANTDLLSFEGTPGAPATAFAITDLDGNPADVDFAPPGYAGRWVTLAVGSHANTPFFAVRTHEADGRPNPWQILESFDNVGPAVGRPFFGVEDPFNSHNDQVGVVFDNLGVSTLKPGDTDFDGDVDFADAMALVHFYSGAGVAADTGNAVAPGFDADLWLWTLGDFDQDGDVDFADALQLVAHYDGAGNSISPPGSFAAASLVVDVVTGTLTVESDGPLSGIAITGQNLSGTAPDLDLALAADADSFIALSLQQDFAGGAPLGVSTSDIGDESAWSFSYGVGGEIVAGQVRFVPEPGVALLGLATAATLRRRRFA